MLDLEGKKVLVTGSTRGIGKTIAESLYDLGATVFINGTEEEKCYKTAKKLGNRAFSAYCDISEKTCAETLYSITKEIDILILNASVQYRKEWNKITLDEFQKQININLRASFLLIQKYAPFMQKNCFGRIITIGSVQEAKPHPDMLIYSASKAAQTNIVKSLSLQLAKDGITVNNIAPGVIYTDRNIEALSDPEYAKVVDRTSVV